MTMAAAHTGATPARQAVRRRARSGRALMPVIEGSVFIDRPPEEVFEFLIRTENIPVWDSSVIQAEQVGDGPFGPGTRSKGTSKILGRQFDWVTENVHFDPPRHSSSAPSRANSASPSATCWNQRPVERG